MRRSKKSSNRWDLPGGNLNRYRVVIFDADETLFDFAKAEENALRLLFRELKLELSNEILESYDAINKGLWSLLEQGGIRQSELKIERFRQLNEANGIDADPVGCSESYVKHLSKGTFLIEGAEELCRHMAGAYELVLLSNGLSEVQVPRFKNSRLSRYITSYTISEEAGSSKPSVEIFRYMSEKIGFFDKERMLLVGDSLSSDIKGGNNYGIDTCWFNPDGKPNESDAVPVYEIRALAELARILSSPPG